MWAAAGRMTKLRFETLGTNFFEKSFRKERQMRVFVALFL
jgi:hypothetical protein